jgi:hypothetical protein
MERTYQQAKELFMKRGIITRGKWIVLAVILMLGIFGGCGLEKTDEKKLEDLTYTILEEKEIPQEFLAVIEEKKEQMFKLTYTDEESLYIAVGYGVQQTGGYSISVNQCYLTQNAVYFDTTLIGPSKGEQVNEAKSYPYLVIKTKYSEKNVVFQ